MPTISMFYGILIRMFFVDTDRHHRPHIHAEYQGSSAVYAITDGAVLDGSLPPNKHKLVEAWINENQGGRDIVGPVAEDYCGGRPDWLP